MTDTIELTPSEIAANRAALWAGLRLVAIDTETTATPGGGPLRAVQVAYRICRAGSALGRWSDYLNPGITIDAGSQRIHGITDEHVATQPDFAAGAGPLRDALQHVDGERTIVVAHNIGFDISVLRHEYNTAGWTMPELDTLDTMRLAAHLEVTGRSPKLVNLCDTLDIAVHDHHDAQSDADACAEVAIALLDVAARHGHRDFDTLLDDVSAGATTRTVKASKRSTPTDPIPPAPVLSAEHLKTHTGTLSRRAGKRIIDTWTSDADVCAQLRCAHLHGKATQADHSDVDSRLHQVLTSRAAGGDTAGTATVLAAVLERLGTPPTGSRNVRERNNAARWTKTWAPVLDSLGRCRSGDQCPTCRNQQPCPLDTWRDNLAALVLGDPNNYAHGTSK